MRPLGPDRKKLRRSRKWSITERRQNKGMDRKNPKQQQGQTSTVLLGTKKASEVACKI